VSFEIFDFKRGFYLREAFFREAAGPIPEKKDQAERGLQSVFPRTRSPEKRFQIFCARGANSLRRAPLRGALGKKNMKLPLGATENDFEVCKRIIFDLTKAQKTDEFILNFLHIVYAKGGDYSEKTLRAFAESYLNI
jgi:hypothetical protein